MSSLAHYDVLATLGDRVKDTEPRGRGGLLEGAGGVPGREAMRRLSVQGGRVLCRRGRPNPQLKASILPEHVTTETRVSENKIKYSETKKM